MSTVASNIPQFGRAFNLTVYDNNANVILQIENKTWLPEQLQIEFETRATVLKEFWFATISIYNLNAPTINTLIKYGYKVTLDAGYQNTPYGTIFEGAVFQPTFERVDGIDYKITLHCFAGIQELISNFSSASVAAGLTQRDLVARIAQNVLNPLSVNANFPNERTSSRGEVIFGQPQNYFHDLASFNGINAWFDGQTMQIQQLNNNTTSVPTLQYSPTTGLLSTPQQTQDGLSIRVLLDPRAKVGEQFQLSPDTSIKQAPLVPGNFPSILDQQGLYIIAGVRHIGDSRGNTWDTEITALSPYYYTVFSATTVGGQ